LNINTRIAFAHTDTAFLSTVKQIDAFKNKGAKSLKSQKVRPADETFKNSKSSSFHDVNSKNGVFEGFRMIIFFSKR